MGIRYRYSFVLSGAGSLRSWKDIQDECCFCDGYTVSLRLSHVHSPSLLLGCSIFCVPLLKREVALPTRSPPPPVAPRGAGEEGGGILVCLGKSNMCLPFQRSSCPKATLFFFTSYRSGEFCDARLLDNSGRFLSMILRYASFLYFKLFRPLLLTFVPTFFLKKKTLIFIGVYFSHF